MLRVIVILVLPLCLIDIIVGTIANIVSVAHLLASECSLVSMLCLSRPAHLLVGACVVAHVAGARARGP